jgi:hypothetical protein
MARAQTRLTMAAVAADSVMCLFLASMWLTLATMAAYPFGLITCGKDCLVVTAAIEVGRVAFFPFFALLCPVAMLLYIIRELRSPTPTEPEKVRREMTPFETISHGTLLEFGSSLFLLPVVCVNALICIAVTTDESNFMHLFVVINDA